MSMLIHGAALLDARGTNSDGWIIAEGGLIAATGIGESWRDHELASTLDIVIDANASWVVPGFIDLHVHGGGGHSFDRGRGDIEAGLAVHRRHGTTRSLVSLVSDSVQELVWSLIEIADLTSYDPLVLGSHLEGPFLARSRSGAHDPASLCDPDADAVELLLTSAAGTLGQITLAPELPGALAAIDRFVDAGVCVALGHTEASYEQARAAFDAGAGILTHAFNAMPGISHRAPGPVIAAADTAGVCLEIINDGEHVAAPVVSALMALAPQRVAFVSDAMAAAASADGDYNVGGLQVNVVHGVARLADSDTLAGSTLTLDAALRRAIANGIAPEAAIAALTMAPATALGLQEQFGVLAGGYAADFVILDQDWNIERVFAAGAEIPPPPNRD
jgi:N-acetylglucosamine-6-phosphate deacetylase